MAAALAKLPEEFAPTGAKLSKFPIRPAAPVRPRLFADEAGFVLRLAALLAVTEFIAWWFMVRTWREPLAVSAAAVLRSAKPAWAWLGTRVARPVIAVSLVSVAVLGTAVWIARLWSRQTDVVTAADHVISVVMIASLALPSLGDLCATCVADAVTIERRATAYAWLDMGQAVGALCGIAIGPVFWAAVDHPSIFRAIFFGAWVVVISTAALAVGALRDRGTPRSAWPLGAYVAVLRSPLVRVLAPVSALAAALAVKSLHTVPLAVWDGSPPFRESALRGMSPWFEALAPVAGMVIAARAESRMPNATTLPWAALVCAAVGCCLAVSPIALFGLGVMFVAVPAGIARAAGEMERPIASSLAWSALFLGAAVGAAI